MRCAACGLSLVAVTAAEEAATATRIRRARRNRGHMLTGAILCVALPTLMGLPISLLPSQLLANLVFGVLFGVPLGWAVSRFASSMLGGAAIGALVGIAYVGTWSLLAEGGLGLSEVLVGIATGLLPGAIMGWHVAQDR